MRRRMRSLWFARGRLKAVRLALACLTVLLSLALPAPQESVAAPTFSYFPSPSATDGRMLSIAGDGLSTLGGNTVTLSFSVANTASAFQIGFFDGDDRSVWDANQTTTFPTRFELYEDPLGNGTGTVPVASWTEANMTQNSWRDFTVNTSPSAKSPSGNYFYRLTVRGTTANATYNNFKVRVEGSTYITPTSVFGLMAAKASGISGDATYNGEWDFTMIVPNGASYVGVWDGDFDFGPTTSGGDTDDPNTANTGIPAWSPPSAVAEGAKGQGSPPDDNTDTALRRSPGVNYELIDPDGVAYQNMNVSGNTEWEYFRIDTRPFNASQMDHHASALPAGPYRVHLRGMDWRNLCAMKFDYPIVGQDENGDPLVPPAPFLVGDTVWHDQVADGVRSPTEPGMAGVKVRLIDAVSRAVVGTATTDPTGFYSMTAWNGSYLIELDPSNYAPGGVLEGWQPSGAASRAITVVNANVMSADFGVRPVPRLSVTPDRTGVAGPGDSVSYSFQVGNNSEDAQTIDLALLSTLGWPAQAFDATGTPIPALQLAAGETATVTVTAQVPLGATIGSRDVLRLTATLRSQPAISASAIAETTVRQAVTVDPDNSDAAAPGTSVLYQHTVTNGSSAVRTISLSATSSRGWPLTILAADGTTPISSLELDANGGSATVFVRVSVPSGAARDTLDTTVLTASNGAVSDTATNVTTVGALLTYDDASFANSESSFSLGDTVYARATSLASSRLHYFTWTDPNGVVRRTSPGITSTSSGQATDSYAVGPLDAVGTWTVRVYRTSTGALVDTRTFTVTYSAAISALYATDAATVGAVTAVTSTTDNSSIATITASSIDYRIWWDSDSDGVFDAGDQYILPDGTASTYSGSGSAVSRTTDNVTIPPFTSFTDPGWTMSNAGFPNQGSYNLSATWRVGSLVLDERTTQFFSVPTVGEWFAALSTPSLPAIALIGLVWAGAVARLRSKRAWLSFYLLGALGAVLLTLFVAQALGLDTWLEATEAAQVAWLAQMLSLRISLLEPSGLAIGNHVGWGVFDIAIECSALLEMAAFAALVGFYPPWRAGRKSILILAGVAATYVINLLRILMIVAIISWLGTGWVFAAHAVIGRVFFFTGVVAIFWFLVTRTTVRTVSERLEAANG